jgi:6-phosphogluconolactonase (cycloisomerase 2 family)
VEGGVGTVMGTVTVPIVCTNNLYTIGGTVSGLAPFQQVTLTDNGSDNLTVSANGSFTFASKLFYKDNYSVQVTGQPAGENCTVQMGAGTVPGTSNVTSVVVSCLTVPPENAYVIDNGGPTVALFNMNAGLLTASPSAMAIAPTGMNPLSIALDPLDHYAYVANQADGPPGTLSEFSINPDGSLSPLSTATIAAGTGPQFVAVSPNDNAVYALNGPDATVSQYALGAGGLLSSLNPSTVATGADAAANPLAMAINSTGAFAYVVNQGDNSVTEFSMAVNGALTAVATTPTGNGPNSVALAPNGLYLYITNATDNTVSQFSIAGGALTALSEGPIATNTGASPTWVVVDPTSTYVYVADNGNNISEYTITGDGSLAANATAASIGTGATPTQLAFDQTGAFLFSAENSGNVDEYALDPTTGALTLEGTVSAGSNAVAIATAYLPR